MYRIIVFSLTFLMWCYFVFSDSFRIDCTALRSLRSSGCNLRSLGLGFRLMLTCLHMFRTSGVRTGHAPTPHLSPWAPVHGPGRLVGHLVGTQSDKAKRIQSDKARTAQPLGVSLFCARKPGRGRNDV